VEFGLEIKSKDVAAHYTGQNQFPPWNNFDTFLYQIGLQTRMCEWFISPSVWIIKVDTSVEWPKTESWGWAEGFFLCCSFIFTYLSNLNT
jgi:hypothetical protein